MDTPGTLTMSTEELNRLAVLNRALDRRLTQAQAAEQLGLSVRQVERLCRKLRSEGPRGLVSKKRGRTSNRKLSEKLRREAVQAGRIALRRFRTHPARREARFAARVDYNERFGKEPLSGQDVHRPVREDEDLDEILRWQEDRRMSKELTLHYRGSEFLIDPSPETMSLRGRMCRVYADAAGQVEIRSGGRSIPFRAFKKIRRRDPGRPARAGQEQPVQSLS